MGKRKNIEIEWKSLLFFWGKRLLIFLFFCFVFWIVFFLAIFKNPIFSIKQVESNLELPPGMKTSFYGMNVFKISSKELFLKLKESYPYAKDIRIVKKLPNTISIYIEERKPVLFVRRKGVIYPIDKDAVVLEANMSLPRSVMEVLLPPEIKLREGDIIKSESIFSAIELLNALKETGLLEMFDFEYIDALQPYELRVKLKNGPIWKLRGAKYKDKLELFKKRLLPYFLEELPNLSESSYLLFLEDGTITLNP